MSRPLLLLLAFQLCLPQQAVSGLGSIAEEIRRKELQAENLKPGNEARLELVSQSPTPHAFLYLHGFSASPRECSPLVETLARSWKANAYYPRYRGHGIHGPDGLKGVKLEDWQQETREALKLAQAIGDRVIVVAMSTGASLAVPALLENPRNVAALVMLAPNFRLHRLESELLRLPYGAWIARLLLGPYREWEASSPEHENYWSTRYPSEAVVEAVRAEAAARNAELETLDVPVLLAYSPDDRIIHVGSLLKAFDRIGSATKALLPVLEADNPHNIAGEILSPRSTPGLTERIQAFLGSL